MCLAASSFNFKFTDFLMEFGVLLFPYIYDVKLRQTGDVNW